MKRIWVMKDGTKIKIKNMETSHIKNCVKMLERKYKEHNNDLDHFWFELDGFNPEFHKVDLSECPYLLAFEKELEKRKEL